MSVWISIYRKWSFLTSGNDNCFQIKGPCGKLPASKDNVIIRYVCVWTSSTSGRGPSMIKITATRIKEGGLGGGLVVVTCRLLTVHTWIPETRSTLNQLMLKFFGGQNLSWFYSFYCFVINFNFSDLLYNTQRNACSSDSTFSKLIIILYFYIHIPVIMILIIFWVRIIWQFYTLLWEKSLSSAAQLK